jgi:hypothetical protein
MHPIAPDTPLTLTPPAYASTEGIAPALLTFLSAKAPDDKDRPGRHLAQLEAGTGKTVAM